MSLRAELCFRASRALLPPPRPVASGEEHYAAWREEALQKSWSRFSDADITGKDVLDFGCGEGQLALYLAKRAAPKTMVGVDIDAHAIDRANAAKPAGQKGISFLLGSVDGIPVADQSFDTLLAFDCMEHVMDPKAILAEWHRVLRPGGKVLIEWFTFKGPWGPHMNALVPVPWAHVIFGERALFAAAARIYDDPAYTPGHWDLDDAGNKKPNKWKGWSSFAEQEYLNELAVPEFVEMAKQAGFAIARHKNEAFGDGGAKKAVAEVLVRLPVLGEYFTGCALFELQRR